MPRLLLTHATSLEHDQVRWGTQTKLERVIGMYTVHETDREDPGKAKDLQNSVVVEEDHEKRT